jgi:hypothetical protein
MSECALARHTIFKFLHSVKIMSRNSYLKLYKMTIKPVLNFDFKTWIWGEE